MGVRREVCVKGMIEGGRGRGEDKTRMKGEEGHEEGRRGISVVHCFLSGQDPSLAIMRELQNVSSFEEVIEYWNRINQLLFFSTLHPFSFHFLSPLLPLCPFSLSLLLINICSIQLGAIPKKWNCRNRPRTAEGDERFDSLIPPQHRRTVRETKDFEVYSSSLLFSLLFYDLQKKRNKTLMVNT